MGEALPALGDTFPLDSPLPARRPGRDATVAVVASKPFTKLLEQTGPDAARLREQSLRVLLPRYGLSPKALEDDDARIPHSLSVEMLERTAWWLGSPSFALDAVKAWKLGDQGLGDYLNATCETVGDSLRTMTSYVGLLNDGIRFTLEEDGAVARFRYQLGPGVIDHPWIAEFSLGKVVAELRSAFHGLDDFRPLRVRFTHQAPAHVRDYQSVFHAPVAFGDDICALELPYQSLSRQLPTADATLNRLLMRQAATMLKPAHLTVTLVDQVRKAIAQELTDSGAPQAAVARRLGMSTATLRRRLEFEHGVRYSDMLEQIRRERVAAQLASASMTIDAISYEAGFSRTTTFYRAFKRWFGCTPGEYRRLHANG
jgi:AraC-like DNA-binding protein